MKSSAARRERTRGGSTAPTRRCTLFSRDAQYKAHAPRQFSLERKMKPNLVTISSIAIAGLMWQARMSSRHAQQVTVGPQHVTPPIMSEEPGEISVNSWLSRQSCCGFHGRIDRRHYRETQDVL